MKRREVDRYNRIICNRDDIRAYTQLVFLERGKDDISRPSSRMDRAGLTKGKQAVLYNGSKMPQLCDISFGRVVADSRIQKSQDTRILGFISVNFKIILSKLFSSMSVWLPELTPSNTERLAITWHIT